MAILHYKQNFIPIIKDTTIIFLKTSLYLQEVKHLMSSILIKYQILYIKSLILLLKGPKHLH